MAYSIGYGPQRNEKPLKKTRAGFAVMVLLFFIVFFVSVQLFSQEGAQLLRRMILPMGDETAEAFSAMIHSVEAGTPVAEAVTTFCREVIAGAQLP